MPNQHLLQRLVGIQDVLMGVHRASSPMSAATSGQERAAFIDQFLSQAFSSPYRFGTGDATDIAGNRSGQLDVVVELPTIPSVPLVGAGNSRLYLAEGVAAVVEVKSNIGAQWSQALGTAAQLSPLRRSFGASVAFGALPSPEIPLFIASYTGWNQVSTVTSKLSSAPTIDGILVVEHGIFVSSQRFQGITATGPQALWAFICCLHQATNRLPSAETHPLAYAA